MIYDRKPGTPWMALPSARWLLSAAAVLLATQTVHAQSSILNTNLIVNGDAEAGPAAASGKTVVSSIPGWTVTGKANVLPYGLTGYILLSDSAPPDHAFQYFECEGGGKCTLTQSINVSSGTSIISAGNLKYTASAYLGGADGTSNTAEAVMAFQNAGGQTISTATLGPLGATARSGIFLQQNIGLVPSGTALITITLSFTGTGSAADSLSLIFSTLGTSPGAVLGSNLVVNPGAEAGPSAQKPDFTLYIPGWSTTDGVSVAPYGGTGWIQLTDPGPPDRGVNLFCKVLDGDADLYQDLDVSAAATLIDSGQVASGFSVARRLRRPYQPDAYVHFL